MLYHKDIKNDIVHVFLLNFRIKKNCMLRWFWNVFQRETTRLLKRYTKRKLLGKTSSPFTCRNLHHIARFGLFVHLNNRIFKFPCRSHFFLLISISFEHVHGTDSYWTCKAVTGRFAHFPVRPESFRPAPPPHLPPSHFVLHYSSRFALLPGVVSSTTRWVVSSTF